MILQLINKRFKTDNLWSIIGGFLHAKRVAYSDNIGRMHYKKHVQYIHVVPQPGSDYNDSIYLCDYNDLKMYLDFLTETVDNLELQNIFSHCDEAVYSKLIHIMWKSRNELENVFLLKNVMTDIVMKH